MKTTIKNLCAIFALILLMISTLYIIPMVYAEDVYDLEEVNYAKPSETVGVTNPEVKYDFNLTTEGKRMLARLVYLEARGNSNELRRCITEVVLNRMVFGHW